MLKAKEQPQSIFDMGKFSILKYVIILFSLFTSCAVFVSCNRNKKSKIEIIRFNERVLDSLISISDTTYIEYVGRKDFYTIDHYINTKNSIEARIFKDSIGHVVGYTTATNGIMTFVAEYYSNGQIKGVLPPRPSRTGPATYFYADGRIRSKGQFKNGNYAGVWYNYNEEGVLTETIHYDGNGNESRVEKK